MSSTAHDILAERDFRRLKEIGIYTVREGLRWHLIDKNGRYDFSSAIPILDAARRHGIQVVWDLLHFGWPERLDIFNDHWLSAFEDFALAFGRLLRERNECIPFVAPVNEISFLSWAGGDTAYLNPFAQGRGAELKRQLVKAVIAASDALRATVPDVRLVAPEPVIHIVGNPAIPNDVTQAEEYRSAMFEAWDMIAGRAQPDLGGDESYLDIIGINYYDRNQWFNHGETIGRGEPQYRPFREILIEVSQRYRRPFFISETGTEDEDRPAWLAYIAGEARAAARAGHSAEGICLYPILNHPGWDDDRHCCNGLWDYPTPDGDRSIYQPLADELARQKTISQELYDTPNVLLKSGRLDLPFSPAMEFCFSASSASDEPFC